MISKSSKLMILVLIFILVIIGIISFVSMENTIVKDVESGNAVLIDVRTQEEWDQQHARGASHFELQRLQSGEVPSLDKSQKIYVYCRSGVRAQEAQNILTQQGFSQVVSIGGLTDWYTLGGK